MKYAFFTQLMLLLFVGTTVAATPVYWDINGATAGGSGTTAATGNWDTTTTNWSTDSAGAVATQVWNNAGNNIAVFSAGTGVTAASTITVPTATPLTLAGITREEGSPTINDNAVGASPITFSDGTNLAIDTGTGTLVVNAFYGTTNGVITKTGTGIYSSGVSQSTFAGKWVINQGSLSVGGDLRLGVIPGAVVPDQVTLSNGAKIRTSTAAAVFTANRGIKLVSGGGFDGSVAWEWDGPISGTGDLGINGTNNVTLKNTSNSWGGDLAFTAAGGVTNAASEVIPDTATVKLIAGAAYTLNGFNETVKSVSGAGGTVAVGATTFTVAAPNGETYSGLISASAGGKFVKNGSGTLTLAGDSVGFNGEMVLNAGKVGVGISGALGDSSTASIVTLAGATLANTAATGRTIPATASVNLNADFTVDDSLNATPGQILFNGPATIKGGDRTINVAGAGNLGFGGVVGQDVAGRSLIKNGAGTLVLNAINTYTGGTTINGGMINVDGDGTLGDGTGTLTLNGGKLNITASRTTTTNPIANPINVTADSAITTTSTAATVQTNITTTSITGTGKLTLRNDAPSGTGAFLPRLSSALTTSTPIEIANGAFGTTELDSFNTTSTTQTFNGVISGTGSYVRNASSAGTGGTTVFTAANTYSGGTTVSRGALIVNNTTGSGTGTGAVTVSTDGMLAGTGSMSGAVTTSGSISPGATVGAISALAVGALTFNSGSSFVYDLNSDTSTGDLLNANGALTLPTSGATLALTDAGNTVMTPGTKLTLISYAGAWNNAIFDTFADDSTFTLGVNTFTIDYNDPNGILSTNLNAGSFGNYVTLTVTAVPEANAFWLGGAICLVLGLSIGTRKLIGVRSAA